MAIVTFEAVAAAAETLQIAGQRPSVRAVIAHLGGGSPNAVLKYLAEWKAGRPVVRIEDTALDTRITLAIIDQMQRVAVTAAAAAEERAAGIEDDLQALAEAQQAAEQQIEALTAERDTAQQQADELTRQLADEEENAERSLQHATEQASALRVDLAGERKHQEQTAAALAKAEVRLEALPDLHTEIERLRAALDTENKARAVAEQQAAVLAAKLEDSVRHVSEIESRASKAEQQAQKAVADANAVAMKASENAFVLAAKLEDSERRAVKSEQQVQVTARDLVSANAAVQAGQARLESAAREIEDARKAAAEARAAAKKSGEESAELRGKLAGKAELKPLKKPSVKAE